ncbi:Cof-type HAD-IIB family hydrolase [Ruminococcaceae bacterium OttesenSCG-928-D13]|nr:Cof-type HAD-IIB family hydrolase [Ruminococcaceae bacterium OttesenSCG-928-D13]
MKGSIRDILVVSDMDGTLLGPDHQLAPADMETIRLFIALGGHFTVATGRTFASIAMYPELKAVIDPAITCGGAVIYDFAKNEAAKSFVLPHLAARQAMRDLLKCFPGLGAMVMGNDMRLYKVAHSEQLMDLIQIEKMTYFTRPGEDLPAEWNKVLFAGPDDVLSEVQEYTKNRTYPGVYFVKTNEFYYEMMPKGVSKGSALDELCTLLGVSIKNTVVIGDYYNDLAIMKKAGHAVAMENAPQEVLDASDEQTASNQQSGVGQYLYKLIRKYESD